MTKLRFLLVIIIILFTAFFLQYTKVIDFMPKLFWVNSQESILNENQLMKTTHPEGIPIDYDQYYILYDSNKSDANNIYYHLREIFRNAHIAHTDIDVLEEDLTDKLRSIPMNSRILIANELTESLTDDQLDIIKDHVEKGSYLDILIRSYDERLQEFCGFSSMDGFIDAYGIHFEEPIFPGLDEVSVNPKMLSSSSIKLKLSQKAELLISSIDDDTPLLWRIPYRKGSVLFANTTLFQDKLNRGLLLQYILDHGPYGIATSFNKKIFNIDDFPAPLPFGINPKIFKEYQRNTLKFYHEVWWSDIRDLTVRYDLHLTGMIIGTYNDDTIAPMEPLDPQDLETINYSGRKLNEVNGEFGIHGYNHNSMLLEGETDFDLYNYHPWPSVDDMVEALTYLKSEMYKKFGKIAFHTYVAPSNLASRATKEAVLTAFPEMKIFSGIYTGSKKVKASFIQEFGPDPDFPGTYDFPRFSSGYIHSPDTMWNIYNGIAELGVFNHFIHPDDILDPIRSEGHDWNYLDKGITQILKETTRNFPFLEPATDYEAYLAYLHYENMQLYSKQKDSTIEIWLTNAPLPTMCYLRVDASIIDTDGVTLIPMKRDGLYMIKITKPHAVIKLLD